MSKEDEGVEFTIDELEQIIENGTEPLRKHWTDRENAIIYKYYGRVPTIELAKHLPRRNANSIRLRAQSLGVSFQR